MSAEARKEHGEFSSNIDMIDVLPPGLYEAVIEAKTESTEGSEFVTASGSCAVRRELSTTSGRLAETMQPMIGASPLLQECPRSISRSTAASCGHSSGKTVWRRRG